MPALQIGIDHVVVAVDGGDFDPMTIESGQDLFDRLPVRSRGIESDVGEGIVAEHAAEAIGVHALRRFLHGEPGVDMGHDAQFQVLLGPGFQVRGLAGHFLQAQQGHAGQAHGLEPVPASQGWDDGSVTF